MPALYLVKLNGETISTTPNRNEAFGMADRIAANGGVVSVVRNGLLVYTVGKVW